MSKGVVQFNPYTGKPRHPSDIASDPEGVLIWDGETPLKAAPIKRPPNDRGQGRKPLPPEQKAVVGAVRLTPGQWEKFRALGGAAWLRDRIDRAKVKE